ncbi:AAA family ATPase [Paracoccus sp. Ld10]|uniref:AAA family ATPase n=1 Tax=Paracoccus sp. Ld10 TaxID=649158 RepID=UPI0038634FC8
MDNASETTACPSFATAPDRHQLYLTEAHRDNLAMIKAWTKFDRGLLSLSGPAKVGKTVLASELAALLSGSMNVARVNLDRPGIDLAQEVPKAFGINAADPLDELARLFARCRASYRKCVLIVDNAHLISEASKEFLEQYTAASGLPQPLYVLLVGRGEATALLAPPVREELRRRLGGHLRMHPFLPAETSQYIAHRFRARKCPCHEGNQPFDAGSLLLIHMASGGYPGHIDNLVRYCLSQAGGHPGDTLDERFVHACLASMAQAKTLPYPLPELPSGEHEDRPTAAETPTLLASLQGNAALKTHEFHDVIPQDDPLRRRWLTPALAGAATVGVIALAGTWIILGRGPADQSIPVQTAAVQQPAAEPAPPPVVQADPPPVVQPDPPIAQLDTRVEDALPDPRQLLTQALAVGGDDPESALWLYTRAALWGSERAAYYLGQLYETGVGVEANVNSARAWYRNAAQIDGAAARLRDLETAPPMPATTDLVAAMPERQTILAGSQSELYWRGASGTDASRYLIEFVAAGTQQVQELETDLTAALIGQPVSRWRVIALRRDGTPGPASPWTAANQP